MYQHASTAACSPLLGLTASSTQQVGGGIPMMPMVGIASPSGQYTPTSFVFTGLRAYCVQKDCQHSPPAGAASILSPTCSAAHGWAGWQSGCGCAPCAAAHHWPECPPTWRPPSGTSNDSNSRVSLSPRMSPIPPVELCVSQRSSETVQHRVAGWGVESGRGGRVLKLLLLPGRPTQHDICSMVCVSGLTPRCW
jgi:hypothetical protein